MKVPMRTTFNGTEYWDNVAKKTLFVPSGKEPHFEVTENPASLLTTEKLIEGKVIDTQTDSDLDEMDADQLRDFAEKNDIELPANIKKEDSIRKFIAKKLTPPAADAQ